jgi:hypothetical protein
LGIGDRRTRFFLKNKKIPPSKRKKEKIPKIVHYYIHREMNRNQEGKNEKKCVK